MRASLFAISAIAVAWLAIVGVTAPAGATETIIPDGVWWSQLTRDEQINVVEGEIDGFRSGVGVGVGQELLTGTRALVDWLADHKVLAREEKAGRLSTAEFDRIQHADIAAEGAAEGAVNARSGPTLPNSDFPRTFGSYADAITDFYTDHPDTATAWVSEVMLCLSTPPVASCDAVAKHHR
ncbi:MAG: hypothetical protein KGM44_08930 [bacterium]|nr:hypothetical protein [bacterium]